jgi:peptidoglycan/LPS O-acetylase OafA/YrhL
MRYIADSSYWVYLIHLPFTAIIPTFIWEFPLTAVVKFLIVLTTTILICLVSYHFLVGATFIGNFLNGRKYPIRKYLKP